MAEWRKAIPEARDRLQSKVLVWVVGSLLVFTGFLLCSLLILNFANHYLSNITDSSLRSQLIAFGVSLTFAVVVWALKAATPAAAFFGGIICLALTMGLPDSFLLPLLTLFILTFLSTRAGKQMKQKAGLAESGRGRSASQVIANLGVAPLIPFLGLVFGARLAWPMLFTMVTAALVEATADTVSSEIGQAYGGRPFLLSTLERVEPGIDGAVSLRGTAAGTMAGVLVAAVAFRGGMGELHHAEIAVAAGTAGLIFDSLLGATIERKGWLGNDLVNFSSTIFAALMVVFLFWMTGGTLTIAPLVDH